MKSNGNKHSQTKRDRFMIFNDFKLTLSFGNIPAKANIKSKKQIQKSGTAQYPLWHTILLLCRARLPPAGIRSSRETNPDIPIFRNLQEPQSKTTGTSAQFPTSEETDKK